MLSQNVKNFLTLFEATALPELIKGEVMTVYISSATMSDPQVQELLGVVEGQREGSFMGVPITTKPDMTVEVHNPRDIVDVLEEVSNDN